MKAIRVHKCGPPEVLQLESNVPIPNFGHDEVLVKVMCAGVNPFDAVIRDGSYPMKLNFPYTPGMDASGIVEQVGKDVQHIKGDRVFCTRGCVSGAYAEFSVFRANSVFPLPQKLNFAQGAAIGVPYFTAFRALFHKAHAKAGETVLIHGASGAVGLAAVQIGRAYGLKVFGTAGTDEGLKLVTACGAHAVFNHRNANYTDEIMKASEGGKGVDLILEMLGNVNLGKDMMLAKMFGRIIIIGSKGSVEIIPTITMGKDLMISGTSLLNATDCEWKEMSSALTAGMETGWLQPVIDRLYPLEKAADSHIDIMGSSGHKGKLILAVVNQ